MTGSLRSSARNPVAIALMGGLILVFLILGVGGSGKFPDLFNPTQDNAVVTAGSHAISATSFHKIFENERARQQKDHPELQITPELLVQNGVDQAMLTALGQDQALYEALARNGVTPGDELVDAEIRKLPAGIDRVTGVFDIRTLEQALASQGATLKEVHAEIADQMAVRHLGFAVQAGYRVPRVYTALTVFQALDLRDVSYFTLSNGAIVPPAQPSDAQLLAFIKQYGKPLPEFRVFTVARISAKALEPSITVDADALAKEFAFKKDSLSTPEKRSITQIPLKNAAQAPAVMARLAKNEDPAAIAASVGAQAVIYAEKPLSSIADRKLADVAFKLKTGEISSAVQGDLGMAILRIDHVTPAVTADAASARAKIEAELRTKLARNKAYDLSQKYDEARQGGAGVIDAAHKVGLALVTVGPITADGRPLNGAPDATLDAKVLKTGFGRAAGEETDIIDADPGEYYALRVEKVIPSALPNLVDHRAELTRAYMQNQFNIALRAKATAMIEQLKKGAAIEKVAAEVNATVTHLTGMQRIKAKQYEALGGEMLQNIFLQKPGAVFPAAAQGGVYIGKLDAVHAPEPLQAAKFLSSIQGGVTHNYLEDLVASTKLAAGQGIKVTKNQTLALSAIPVDPSVAPKPAGKPVKP